MPENGENGQRQGKGEADPPLSRHGYEWWCTAGKEMGVDVPFSSSELSLILRQKEHSAFEGENSQMTKKQ